VTVATISVTETFIPTPTLAGIGSTMIGADGATLVYVPEGEFTMGGYADNALVECQKFRTDCQRSDFIDEEPPHSVLLKSFWIDQTEVTNIMYEKCVAAGNCEPPLNTNYFSDSSYANHPVVYVNWNQASTYCGYAGRRLPSEAEWEKAASWDNDKQIKRLYSWGDGIDCSFGNFYDNLNIKYCTGDTKTGDTTPVKSYESGKSPYGAYDMTGNVWEWVNDWYGETYYQVSPSQNPLGPDSGTLRVLRGGSWSNYFYNVRSRVRYGLTPAQTFGKDHDVGFRCASSIP
jgi:formylglycine-generating enzyme required for sulfatase activity